MADWKTFSLKKAKFSSDEEKEEYLNRVKCAVCHESLKEGEKFALVPITNNPGFNQQAVIVHKKCTQGIVI